MSENEIPTDVAEPEVQQLDESALVTPEPVEVIEVAAENAQESKDENAESAEASQSEDAAPESIQPIVPPAMLGVLGGGQLGRMFTIAAKTMGYRVTVLDPDPDSPAAELADEHICAAYDDAAALEKLAQCAAVTTEFENVNAEAMKQLEQHTRVTPIGEMVAIAQNRISEKIAIRKSGLPVCPYQAIRSASDITENTAQLLPGILKTATLGYDGKGQRTIKTMAGLHIGLSSLMKDAPFVLERMLNLGAEISVIVCRLDDAHTVSFPPAENIHENGILAYSIVPARLPEDVLHRAEVMARHLAQKLNYVGVLAVEMFMVGEKMQLVVNEMAPRPHNSGHYTIDACLTNQFQQQVRILCGLPPSKPVLYKPCCMVNLLGDIWADGEPNWTPLLSDPDVRLHIYGKKEARPGRKMGHFTVLADKPDDAFNKAQELFSAICLR